MIPLPDELLRAVIRCGDEAETDLSRNLHHLRNEIEPEGIELEILKVAGYLHERALVVPTVGTLLLHFTHLDEKNDGRGAAGQLRLRQVVASDSEFLTGVEFRTTLDRYKERVSTELLSAMLLDTSNILGSGVEKRVLKDGKWQPVIAKGVTDAMLHIADALRDIKKRVKQSAIEGNFREEGERVRQQYAKWRDDPTMRMGVLSGIERMDRVHKGAKNGELLLVMGFVSHLKTSFCLNWLYRAAVYYGRNVAIVSLETAVDVVRTVLYVMHAGHPKFEGALGLGQITYDAVTSGALGPEEFELWERVIDDFTSNPEYGQIAYKEPQESCTIEEIAQWAEALHAHASLDLLLIDYLGLVDPGKNVSGLQENSNLNRVIRQAKLLAMSFGGGRGIPVLSPFQANREGLKDAEKAGGRYKLTALANANESERSADVVYYVYLDDNLRSSTELAMGNLKARNAPLINEQWHVFADPATRIITNPNPTSRAQQVVEGL